ncbi:MAG: DUF488 domain-containing protein [Haloarculaceae archaeon]
MSIFDPTGGRNRSRSYGSIDENYPELGPPESLLDEANDRQEKMQMQGMCEEGAHNAAWEDIDFAKRYREYLARSSEAQATVNALGDRVRAGEDVVLVCYESDDKRCHRHVLLEELAAHL